MDYALARRRRELLPRQKGLEAAEGADTPRNHKKHGPHSAALGIAAVEDGRAGDQQADDIVHNNYGRRVHRPDAWGDLRPAAAAAAAAAQPDRRREPDGGGASVASAGGAVLDAVSAADDDASASGVVALEPAAAAGAAAPGDGRRAGPGCPSRRRPDTPADPTCWPALSCLGEVRKVY